MPLNDKSVPSEPAGPQPRIDPQVRHQLKPLDQMPDEEEV
jgi:hypothetical protein